MVVSEAQFDGTRADVRASRTFVGDAISRLGFGDLADTAALLTSEIVTNAVLHARSAVTVRVVLADRLVRVEVDDSSPAPPVRKRYSERSTTGRGIMLVEVLGHGWGVDDLSAGKRVWFTLDPDRATEVVAAEFDAGVEAPAHDGTIDLDALAASLDESDPDADSEAMVLTP